MTTLTFTPDMPGLPDPVRDPQFYEGVPARRFAAWLIDVAIVLAIGLPIALIFGIVTFGLGFMLFWFLISSVGYVYRVITLAGGSATWGMRAMGIEMRRHDGGRFDLVTAALHAGIYAISIGVVVLQALSCLLILGTRYRQGLSDIILRTTAINRPAD
jgi:uncharacterized RDD family membrane protein YckC